MGQTGSEVLFPVSLTAEMDAICLGHLTSRYAYVFVEDDMTWDGAHADCAARGGSLPAPSSQEAWEMMVRELSKNSLWAKYAIDVLGTDMADARIWLGASGTAGWGSLPDAYKWDDG